MVFANSYSADDDYQEIEKCADEFQRLFEEEALPTIEDAVFPILVNDKDFLFRFNAKITEQNLTIEHILPQDQNLSPVWQQMLGADWQQTQNRYLHTLGNLTLL